jgi:SagB-type dehydrogenase family enzyme
VEAYLVGNLADYARQVFHYDPVAHALEHVASAREDFEIATLFHPSPGYTGIAPTVLVFTSVWQRIACKYGNFGYVLALLEAGHMAQNILLMATAIDVGARPMAGFSDEVVNELLQIDGINEQALYAVALSSARLAN